MCTPRNSKSFDVAYYLTEYIAFKVGPKFVCRFCKNVPNIPPPRPTLSQKKKLGENMVEFWEKQKISNVKNFQIVSKV